MLFRLDLPDIDDICALADWLETMMLVSKSTQVSRSELADRLTAQNEAIVQDLEVSISLLFKEIGRRRRVAGHAYPFVIESALIKLDPEANSEFYKFCLLISLGNSPLRQEQRYKEIDEIFDKVVCEAAKSYLGKGSNALRFGWPPSDGRPTDFGKALDWVSEKTGIALNNTQRLKLKTKEKDGGVDVVAWKPFDDHRAAFVVALIQCTVKRDWFPKGKDVCEYVWLANLDTGRPVLTSLAVPFVIHKNYDKWDDLRRIVNIIFDRLRLAQVLAGCDSSSFSQMKKWTKDELSKFKIPQ